MELLGSLQSGWILTDWSWSETSLQLGGLWCMDRCKFTWILAVWKEHWSGCLSLMTADSPSHPTEFYYHTWISVIRIEKCRFHTIQSWKSHLKGPDLITPLVLWEAGRARLCSICLCALKRTLHLLIIAELDANVALELFSQRLCTSTWRPHGTYLVEVGDPQAATKSFFWESKLLKRDCSFSWVAYECICAQPACCSLLTASVQLPEQSPQNHFQN